MVKVYYLMHSSFVVELMDRYLLFDYFNRDDLSAAVEYRGGLNLILKNLFTFFPAMVERIITLRIFLIFLV